MVSKIPLRTVKRIIKENWDGEISQDCCVYVKDFLMSVLQDLIECSIQEFEEKNVKRKQQRLPELKRIDANCFIKVANRLYTLNSLVIQGDVEQSSREPNCSMKEAVEVV